MVIKQETIVPFHQPPPTEKARNSNPIRERDADDHRSYHRDSSREQDDLHDLRRRPGYVIILLLKNLNHEKFLPLKFLPADI